MRWSVTVRVGAWLDRAKFVTAVRDRFHPAMETGMTRVVLLIVVSARISLIDEENKILGGRHPVWLIDLSRNIEAVRRVR